MRPPLERGDVAALTGELARLDDPRTPDALLRLLRTLHAVGRRDLPLGRLFEGHVDAVQIVARYGSPEQVAKTGALARGGAVLGVWNADREAMPLTLTEGRLDGGKAFASGAGLLTHALVTSEVAGGRQLILVDLATAPPTVDRSWWRVTGMQRSETHLVAWSGAAVPAEATIGRPGDYLREPWFSGGAIRFAAVQAGGVAALVDQTRDHLVASARADDAQQSARLAKLYLAAQSAADAVTRAARAWNTDDVPATLAQVAAARAAVYAAGERAITLAQAAVGVQAMFVDHPLTDALNDLTVYLRQPGPDAQLRRAGGAVAAGLLTPSF